MSRLFGPSVTRQDRIDIARMQLQQKIKDNGTRGSLLFHWEPRLDTSDKCDTCAITKRSAFTARDISCIEGAATGIEVLPRTDMTTKTHIYVVDCYVPIKVYCLDDYSADAAQRNVLLVMLLFTVMTAFGAVVARAGALATE